MRLRRENWVRKAEGVWAKWLAGRLLLLCVYRYYGCVDVGLLAPRCCCCCSATRWKCAEARCEQTRTKYGGLKTGGRLRVRIGASCIYNLFPAAACVACYVCCNPATGKVIRRSIRALNFSGSSSSGSSKQATAGNRKDRYTMIRIIRTPCASPHLNPSIGTRLAPGPLSRHVNC